MSMVMMPILIKVKMTEENFKKLLGEAVKKYYRSYLTQYYRYDGTYFTLDMCAMDNPEIFIEATNIAKFADCENQLVGFIYDEGPSYSVSELLFSDGVALFNRYAGVPRTGRYKEYMHKKESFLEGFPPSSKNLFDVAGYISTLHTNRTYTCVSMTEDALERFFQKKGYFVEDIAVDDGWAYIEFSDKNASAQKIIAKHYGCDDVLILSTPNDFKTPDEYLLILIYLNCEESRRYTIDDYKAYHDRISALPNCTTCGNRVGCKYLPLPGQTVRINCPLWKEQEQS